MGRKESQKVQQARAIIADNNSDPAAVKMAQDIIDKAEYMQEYARHQRATAKTNGSRVTELEDLVAKLKERIDTLEDAGDVARLTYGENTRMQTEMHDISAQLETKDTEIRRLTSENADLKKQLQDIRDLWRIEAEATAAEDAKAAAVTRRGRKKRRPGHY